MKSPLGDPNLDALIAHQEEENKRPYHDDECRHDDRFELRGILTCQDCGATYDDQLLEWRVSSC